MNISLSDKAMIPLAGVIGRFITIIGTIILARILTPENFGQYALIIAATAWLSILNSANFDKALVIWKGDLKEIYHSILIFSAAIAVVCSIVVLITGHTLSVKYNDSALMTVALILSVGYFIGPLYMLQVGYMSKLGNYKRIAINDIMVAFFALSVGVLAAYSGAGTAALALQSVIPFALVWLFFRDVLDVEWPRKYSREALRHLYAFGLKQNVGSFFELMFQPAIIMLLSLTYSASSIGNFSQAMTLRGTIVAIFLLPLTRILFPKLAEKTLDTSDAILLKSIKALSLIGLPLAGGLYLFGQDLTLILLGGQWGMAGETLSIIGISIGLLLISVPGTQMLIIHGKQGIWIIVNAVSLLILIPVVYAVTSMYEANMIFYSIVIIEFGRSLTFVVIGYRLTGSSGADIWGIPFRVLLITICAVLAVVFVQVYLIMDAQGMQHMVYQSISLVVYTVVILSCFYLFLKDPFTEFLGLFIHCGESK